MSKGTLKSGLIELVAIVAALVGLVVYVITSTTGYLAGRAVDPLPIVLTVIAIGALGVGLVLRDRMTPVVRDVLLLVSVAALAASLAIYLLARVPLAGDVYFIPVNYPEAEATTLHISFVGLALYLVAVIATIVEAFRPRRSPAALQVAVV